MPGSFIVSWGRWQGFAYRSGCGVKRLTIGAVTFIWISVEAHELVGAWADEVHTAGELLQHRLSERGVLN